MSAYICDPEHIKALAVYAIRRRNGSRNVPEYILKYDGGQDMSGKCDEEVASYFADVLYQENIRSVQARYPDDKWGELPGPCEKPEHLEVTARDVVYAPTLTLVAILKMCDALEYQSCETNDWRTTTAAILLDMIRGAAIRSLPGYDAAPWEYTGPASINRACQRAEEAEDLAAAYRVFAD